MVAVGVHPRTAEDIPYRCHLVRVSIHFAVLSIYSGANHNWRQILWFGRRLGGAVLLFRSSTHSDPVTLINLRRNVRSVLLRAGQRGRALDKMEVAVGEVLSNVHRHAYQGDIGPVSVAVFRYPHQVSVVIIDRGARLRHQRFRPGRAGTVEV